MNDFQVFLLINYLFYHLWHFLGGPSGKESVCNAGDLGSIPGLGRSGVEGHGYPLQYSGLENSMEFIFENKYLHQDCTYCMGKKDKTKMSMSFTVHTQDAVYSTPDLEHSYDTVFPTYIFCMPSLLS